MPISNEQKLHHYTRNMLTPSIHNALRAIEKANNPVVVASLLNKIIALCNNGKEVMDSFKVKTNI